MTRFLLPLLLALAAPAWAQEPPRVLVAAARSVLAQPAGLSGVVAPRVSVDLGFPVGGTLVARPVAAGERVAEGADLARLDPQRLELALEAARAELASAEAQAGNAAAVLERQIGMNAGNMVSDSLVDLARLQARTHHAQADAARARLALAEEQLADASLTAPFAGIVIATHGEVGEVIGPGQPVLSLARPGLHDAILDIPELQAQRTALGDPWEVRLEIAPAIRVIGHVREIAPQADATTRTHRLRIALDAPPAAFRFGSTLLARPLAPEGAAALLIPAAALADGAVWVADPQTLTAQPRAVTARPAGGGLVLVTEGLNEGDLVIIAGTGALSPGQRVRVE